jgi:hypothetical protein
MKAAAIRRYKQPVAIVDMPKPSPRPRAACKVVVEA